jgi:hypothetical protein
MASLHCPLPDVAAALSPYIHSRQETQRIRQAITSHFLSHIASEAPLTQLTLPTPTTTTQVRRLPTELPGLRREYLAALRANLAAQHRHAELSAELDALRHDAAHASSPSAGGSTSRPQERETLVRTHVALRRLRRLHRQLRVVEDTVSRLGDEAASSGTRDDMAELVEKELGTAPQPPVIMPDEDSQGSEGVQELVDVLKRQVLGAKAGMLQAQKRRRDMEMEREGMSEPGLASQVAALRQARDTLVEWIEGELGKIAEGETSELSNVAAESELEREDDAAGQDLEDADQKIKALYEAYTTARAELIATTKHTNALKSDFTPLTVSTNAVTASTSASAARSKAETEPETVPLVELLPQVRGLLELARNERFLLQHSSYLRRHLAASTEQTDQMLRRLGDESHLVPPGVGSVADWTTAADDASKNLRETLGGWIQDGNEGIAGAKDILSRMGKGGLGSIKGDV